MQINERIKKLRKELDLDVDTIAAELQISRATYYRYENKEIEKMPITVLVPLARVLHTNPSYLMGWTDNPSMFFEFTDSSRSNNIQPLTPDEEEHITKYRNLSDNVKSAIDVIVDAATLKKE